MSSNLTKAQRQRIREAVWGRTEPLQTTLVNARARDKYHNGWRADARRLVERAKARVPVCGEGDAA